MGPGILVFLALLQAAFSTFGTTDTINVIDNAQADNSLYVGSYQINDILSNGPYRQEIGPNILSGDISPKHILSKNLNSRHSHNEMQKLERTFTQVTKKDLKNISNTKNVVTPLPLLLNSLLGSSTIHTKNISLLKGSRLSFNYKSNLSAESNIYSTKTSDNSAESSLFFTSKNNTSYAKGNRLPTSYYKKKYLPYGPCLDTNGLYITSWSHGCDNKGKNIPGTDKSQKIPEEDKGETASRKHAQTRRSRRIHRRSLREINTIWPHEKNSALSKLKMKFNDLYNDLEKWPREQTITERKVGELFHDMYSDAALSEQVDFQESPHASDYTSDNDQQVESAVDNLVENGRRNELLIQPLGQGDYYFNNLKIGPGEIDKRDIYGNKMRAFLAQPPRPWLRIPLQGQPMGTSSLRIQDKVDRSQDKELTIKPLDQTNKVITETACKRESDGTTPMRCPSNPDQCLYDVMICDGTNDCPNGEDEIFTLCVLRQWTVRLFRKLHSST